MEWAPLRSTDEWSQGLRWEGCFRHWARVTKLVIWREGGKERGV